MSELEGRLQDAIGHPAVAARLPVVAEAFLARRADDAAAAALDGATLVGVARAIGTNVDAARLLAVRPVLLERIANAGKDPRDALRRRAEELAELRPEDSDADLEAFLDGLRLLRREETLFAACLELGDAVPFAETSLFLSRLAEAILARALARAQAATPAGSPADGPLSVIGMGKVGGREFTFHSDLDLLFLYPGGADGVARASRIGQRLVAYLTTMTRMGVAYAVDTRLRPSGNQGLLVTGFEAYVRYQREAAQLWEHLVLMRARAVAGDVERAQAVIDRVRDTVVCEASSPWPEVARMRARVERERADESKGAVAYKTGPGGLMDVDFLAAGARLERGADQPPPPFPGNAAMLASVAGGARIDALVAAYDVLRRLEARNRWVMGRAVESLEPRGERAAALEALLSPGEPLEAFLARVAATRTTVREAFRDVVQAGTIGALEPAASPAEEGR